MEITATTPKWIKRDHVGIAPYINKHLVTRLTMPALPQVEAFGENHKCKKGCSRRNSPFFVTRLFYNRVVKLVLVFGIND